MSSDCSVKTSVTCWRWKLPSAVKLITRALRECGVPTFRLEGETYCLTGRVNIEMSGTIQEISAASKKLKEWKR